jgi:hypothetical protein
MGKVRQARISAAVDIVAEIAPCTVRGVAYKLFTRGLIPDMSRNSTNTVSRDIVHAREEGLIGWSDIVDEKRSPDYVNSFHNAEQLVARAVRQYRRDYWQGQPQLVEVWSEKGTVRGVLAPVLDKWGVTFRSMSGHTSATVVNNIAEMTYQIGKPLLVLYVGVDVDLPGRLQRYGAKLGTRLRRLAVRPDDNLPSFSAHTKRGDSRYRWFTESHGTRCWELDAMDPRDLRSVVENAIRREVDLDQWEHQRAIEEVEMASLRDVLGEWRSRLGQAPDCGGA